MSQSSQIISAQQIGDTLYAVAEITGQVKVGTGEEPQTVEIKFGYTMKFREKNESGYVVKFHGQIATVPVENVMPLIDTLNYVDAKLEESPEPKWLALKAKIIRLSSDQQEAMQLAQKGLELDPEHEQCLAMLASAAFFSNNFDLAEVTTRKIVELYPDNMHGILISAHLSHHEKDFAKAHELYDRAIEMRPFSAPLWANKGRSFIESMEYEEAIECYQKALELSDNQPDMISHLAIAFDHAGQTENARKHYQKAVDLNVDRYYAYIYFARLNVLNVDIALIVRAGSCSDSPPKYALQAARILVMSPDKDLRDPDSGLKIIRKFIERSDKEDVDPEWWKLEAVGFLNSGELMQASDSLEQVAEDSRDAVWKLILESIEEQQPLFIENVFEKELDGGREDH